MYYQNLLFLLIVILIICINQIIQIKKLFEEQKITIINNYLQEKLSIQILKYLTHTEKEKSLIIKNLIISYFNLINIEIIDIQKKDSTDNIKEYNSSNDSLIPPLNKNKIGIAFNTQKVFVILTLNDQETIIKSETTFLKQIVLPLYIISYKQGKQYE